MSHYTKVVIETDARGRMNISALDEKGTGHGYRLAGPKFMGDDAATRVRAELDQGDAEEIRSYLRILDEIRLTDELPELHQLTKALDGYRKQAPVARRMPDYPHQQERLHSARAGLIKAAVDLLAALGAATSDPSVPHPTGYPNGGAA